MDQQDTEEKVMRVLRYGYCGCGPDGIAQEEHTCRFREEIRGPGAALCNCCEKCTRRCEMDI